jgi:2-methylfumaryl-CoA hydratase
MIKAGETGSMAEPGNFFEDFEVGKEFRHATPRTFGDGETAIYIALTGARHPLHSSSELARKLGYRDRPIDDLLLFNLAFGKTVPDISANAVANLGYADVRFLAPVFIGDTITAQTKVIGIRETSGGAAGIVYVRSTAHNQHGEPVLTWIRWVLVKKRDKSSLPRQSVVPEMVATIQPANLVLPSLTMDLAALQEASGSVRTWDDYAVGERINHPAGMTLDESDHTLATKLYQNNAKVHFDALAMSSTPHGARLVYGGHVISVCRALSYDGLENVIGIAGINGGNHRAPTFAGDTLYCFTQIIEKLEIPGRSDCGLLRLRLVGLRNMPAAGFDEAVASEGQTKVRPEIVLDLDYLGVMPRQVT